MRKKGIAVLGALSIAVGLTGPLVAAGTVRLDLSDFNDDVMRDMDDTMKRLDSDRSRRSEEHTSELRHQHRSRMPSSA